MCSLRIITSLYSAEYPDLCLVMTHLYTSFLTLHCFKISLRLQLYISDHSNYIPDDFFCIDLIFWSSHCIQCWTADFDWSEVYINFKFVYVLIHYSFWTPRLLIWLRHLNRFKKNVKSLTWWSFLWGNVY